MSVRPSNMFSLFELLLHKRHPVDLRGPYFRGLSASGSAWIDDPRAYFDVGVLKPYDQQRHLSMWYPA